MAIINAGKDKSGRTIWRVTVHYGRDATGHYAKVEKRVHGLKADALRVERELMEAAASGVSADGRRVTFAEYAREYAEMRASSGELSPGAAATMRRNAERLGDALGRLTLAEITPAHIESALARIQAAHGLGAASMVKLRTLAHQIMQRAFMRRVIMRNPVDAVKPPRVPASTRAALSHEDFARFVRALEESEAAEYAAFQAKETRQFGRGNGFQREYLRDMAGLSGLAAVRLALATGARRGELLALRWRDLDATRGAVSISRTIEATTGAAKEPKTAAGRRVVSIDGATLAALGKWQAFQAAQLRKLGIRQTGETPICCNSSGGYLGPRAFSRWFDEWRVSAGFPGLKLHELRHTQATMLLGAGVDLKTVQTRLGHASAAVTANIYAHAVPGNDAGAAAVVGGMIQAAAAPAAIVQTGIGA